MKKFYFDKLLKKLEKKALLAKNFDRKFKQGKKTITLTLNEWEIEDLFVLWRDEAIKKWGLEK